MVPVAKLFLRRVVRVSSLVMALSFYACGDGVAGGQTPTASLSASANPIATGNTTVLTWSSTNATSCSANGAWSGTLATSGSQTETQWTNQTYGITCTGPGGSASKDVTVVSPQIEVTTDASGVKRFTEGGLPFIPIGVNYFIEYSSGSYHTFDMFDSATFNLTTIDTQMASLASGGFTYVRLWLKGVDTDDGFSRTNAWNLYVSNIVSTIQSAENHGLHVVLTGSFPGPSFTNFVPANYQPTGLPTNVASYNQLLFDPSLSQALEHFYSDLLTAMRGLDANIATGIFYFDLYNELKYDVTALPLYPATGTFTYNGTTYDMTDYTTTDSTDPTSRQALMDQATFNFIQETGYGVKSVMPHVLFTASSLYNYAFNHPNFDGGVYIASTKYYVPRPYFLWQGGASLIDVHNYPSPSFTMHSGPAMLSDELTSLTETREFGSELNAKMVPFLSGEFGADTSEYVTGGVSYSTGLTRGIDEMEAVESGMFCPYGYSGYAVWDWNVVPSDTFVLVDPVNDPSSSYMHALAPLYLPSHQYCSQTVTP